LEDHGDRSRDGVVEGHLPDEDPWRDLEFSLHDLEGDVDHSRRTDGDLFVRREEGGSDQFLGYDLSLLDGKIDDSWIRA
jgi:hypothetical protein